MAEPGEVKTRVFFALWPPAALQQQLHDLAASLQARTGGRAITSERLHLTLAFMGAVEPAQVAALEACGSAMPPLHGALALDQVGFWARTGVVWIGSRDPDPGLLEFTAQLHDRVRRLGFRLEPRPFRPHVTLLRRARRRARIAPVRLNWALDGFTLTASQLDPAGAHYTVLRRWSTAGDVE